MPRISEYLSTRSEITQLQILQNNIIAFSTKFHEIEIISHEENKKKSYFSHLKNNTQTANITFSPDAKLLAFASKDIISIVEIRTSKIIYSIKVDYEIVDILTFDTTSQYIIAGTKNGRVLQYKYDNSSLLSRICSFPYQTKRERSKIKENFISAFAFYENKMACSGYGGAIFITDLYSKANNTIITRSRIRVDALCFLDKDTLISGNVDGVLQIMPLKEKKVSENINAPFINIKQIIVMPNPDFILVSSDANYLALINIKLYKVIDSQYLKFKNKVNKIALLNEEILLVALENSQLLKVELASISRLRSLITHNSLDEAFKLVTKEPMIKGTKEHIELEEKYQLYLKKAISALINNKKDLALQLIEMFRYLPSKKEEIRLIFKAFDEYDRFKALFLEQKYTLSYAMAAKFPALQHTKEYEKMEKRWKGTFAKAQKQMILNKNDEAKKTLSEYVTIVSKRPLINFILNDSKLFLDFLKAIEERDFKEIEELVKENDTFTQIPTYKALNKEIEYNLDGAQENMRTGNVKVAINYLKKLEKIPHLTQRVAKLYYECKNIQKLYSAYSKNNFRTCYEILDTHKCLNYTELGKLLEKNWSKQILKCEKYALKGEIKSIKNSLGDLLTLQTRKDKIGELLRVSFHSKITQLMQKKSFKNAESIIYSYIDIFGLDYEIDIIREQYEKVASTKLAIVQGQRRKVSRYSWINSSIIMH